MKKTIIMALMLLLAVGAYAQEGKRLYTKYSDKPGVSAVYISPAMFKLMGQIPDLDVETSSGEKMDISPLVGSFSGFYMLNLNPGAESFAELAKEVAVMVAKADYELLMEVKDSGSTIRMYAMGDEKIVNSFVCMISGNDQTTFFCLEGAMNRSDLENLIANM